MARKRKKEGLEYAIVTNEITKAWADATVRIQKTRGSK